MKRILGVTLVLAYALAGCGCDLDLRAPTKPAEFTGRTAVVDDAFLPDARAHVLTAIEGWNAAVSGLRIRAITSADAFSFGTPPGAVEILARRSLEDTDCEKGGRALGCWEPPARIELADEQLSKFGGWESVPGHEIGHWLGLRDVDEGHSIMRAKIADQALTPTESDARAVHALGWGQP